MKNTIELLQMDEIYELSNGNHLYIQNSQEGGFSYDYFDGETLKLIDGGYIGTGEERKKETVIKKCLEICGLPEDTAYSLICVNPDLEEEGYTGY